MQEFADCFPAAFRIFLLIFLSPGVYISCMRVVVVTLFLIWTFLPGCNSQASPPPQETGGFLFQASLDRTECSVGETITLKIHLQTEGSSKFTMPQPEKIIDGFDIVSRSVARQSEVVNGKRKDSIQVVQQLMARRPGVRTIPPFTVKDAGGRIHATKALKVVVTGKALPVRPGEKVPPPFAEPPPLNGDAGVVI